MRLRPSRPRTRFPGASRLARSILAVLVAFACAAGAETDRPDAGQPAVFRDPATGMMGVRELASGKIVIPAEHDFIRPLDAPGAPEGSSPGLFVVGRKPAAGNLKYGILDLEKNPVLPPEFDEIGALRDGVIAVCREGKWGFVDVKGRQLVAPEYEEVWSHGRNCAVVRIKGKYGAVDMSGNALVEPVYDGIAAAYPSAGGAYCFARLVVMLDGKRRFVDVGKAAGGGGAKSSGGSGGAGVSKFKDGGKYGFRSSSGGTVVAPVFEDAWDFSHGYARVKRDGKWGFIDSSGKIVVEPSFDYLWDYDGTRAKVRLDDGSTRYIDMTGKLLD